MKKLISAGAIVLMSTGLVFAEAAESFPEADANGDGVVSRGEIVLAELDVSGFNGADIDGSGTLNAQEFDSAY